ncbi:LytTR family DNA-binding domain-containing protein [Iodobacter sp. CM08]|uniref:LytR/AlgR family response regulator transcription factor n=1 Tax=Iodobacter sp. CM08 TaxID=3085902 RepID=UPI0029818BA8|nr:LytTR family DNA-binding domain-containing protein [Iodobacter sp. CM08]MDW5418499.1 LytTR family DNA-binding domain-containing protein [Iodobacter sp. CM08]
MSTALIADDEPLLAASLAERLQALWPELKIVAVVKNGLEAVAEINHKQPDFVFLDIRMPGLSGLQVASTLHHARVVFVTAFDEYAISAFENAALDYLLKPVSDERLAQCVGRLQRENKTSVDFGALISSLQKEPLGLAWLTVGLGDVTRLVAVDEVLFFQSADKYTEVVTVHERHLIRTSLKELLPQLNPKSFAQVHRAYIVNLHVVARIERDLLGRQKIELKNSSHSLPLSRSFAAQFRQM